MSLFGRSTDPDENKRKGYPKCGGPSLGNCEAGNCRSGMIPGYLAQPINGYENCPLMWNCQAYQQYIKNIMK